MRLSPLITVRSHKLTNVSSCFILTPHDCINFAELMDKDIRAALFDGFDEDGEFEELQDDFITQVHTSPSSINCFLPVRLVMQIIQLIFLNVIFPGNE